VDPCARGAYVWRTDIAGIYYMTFDGVRAAAPTCRPAVVPLIAEASWARTDPDVDPAFERAMLVFVCQPHGEARLEPMEVRRRPEHLAWPDFQPPPFETWNLQDSPKASVEDRCARARAAVR